MLEALDERDRISEHGRKIAQKPMHPRLAHMIERANEMGLQSQACQIAALLSERDIAQRNGPGDIPVDLDLRLQALNGKPPRLNIHKGAMHRVKTLSKQWLGKASPKSGTSNLPASEVAGALIALAYPDRVAERRPGKEARYRMSNGRGAALPLEDSLHQAGFLAIATVTGSNRDARIRLASPISVETIEMLFADQISAGETAAWDSRSKSVIARNQRRFGQMVLSDAPAKNIPAEEMARGLILGIRETGLNCLPWNKEAKALRDRIRCLRLTGDVSAPWPNMEEQFLLDNLDNWLAPYLSGKSRLEQLQDLNLVEILKNKLDWADQQLLDELVPSHFTVPSGSQIRIDYSTPEAPVLPVKLQEMFGAPTTPAILKDSLPLTIHLLSPAGRPLQITQDLAAFWENAYPHVKAEMKGRYPKHPWPDNPLTAQATKLTKKRLGQ